MERVAYRGWPNCWRLANDYVELIATADVGPRIIHFAPAGGENVFGGRPTRYPVVEPEEIAAAAPHAVLLSTEPFPFQDRHVEEISRNTALAPEIFHIVDGELLSWHGSRTPRGIDYAAELIARVRARQEMDR